MILLNDDNKDDVMVIGNFLTEVQRLLLEKPDDSWLKADMQDWLRIRNISFTDSETKAQLLEKM